MKRFVISNLQMGRPSAIKKYNRPFKDVDEMDEKIIQSWNSVVGKDDLVYHLGNFAWDPKTAQDAIGKLNGTIWFIAGEHDKPILELGINNMLTNNSKLQAPIMPLHKMEVTISYWPLLDWPEKSKGYWSIVGNPDLKYKSDPKERRINVSADLWKFKPQDLEKVVGIFQDL